MRAIIFFATVLSCLSIITCRTNEHTDKRIYEQEIQGAVKKINVPQNKSLCDKTEFNYGDSTGMLRGTVVSYSDTSKMSSTGVFLLLDNKNDTVMFLFTYYDIPDMDLKQISIGSCIEVNYYADIRRVTSENSEDGPVGYEISRSFYISDIKYDIDM